MKHSYNERKTGMNWYMDIYWCTKHKQHREGRELDVTKSKSVSCRGQREGWTSPDFPVSPGELWNPFSFSLDLSLSLFFLILLILFYFIILSPTPLARCSSWLRTNACFLFHSHFPLSTPSWYQCWAKADSVFLIYSNNFEKMKFKASASMNTKCCLLCWIHLLNLLIELYQDSAPSVGPPVLRFLFGRHL